MRKCREAHCRVKGKSSVRFAGGMGSSWTERGVGGLTVGGVACYLYPKNTDRKVWNQDWHLETSLKCRFSAPHPRPTEQATGSGTLQGPCWRQTQCLQTIAKSQAPRGSRLHLGSLSSRGLRFARCYFRSKNKTSKVADRIQDRMPVQSDFR